MAIIQQGTADGSAIGNPSAGDFYIFNDSNNSDAYTRRDSSGTDIILGGDTAVTPGSYTSADITVDQQGRITAAANGASGAATLRNVTSADTFAASNETINCTSGTFTVDLPTAVGIQGTTYTLVNSGTGTITLDGDGSETINGSLTIEIKKQYISRTVQSNGSNWILI